MFVIIILCCLTIIYSCSSSKQIAKLQSDISKSDERITSQQKVDDTQNNKSNEDKTLSRNQREKINSQYNTGQKRKDKIGNRIRKDKTSETTVQNGKTDKNKTRFITPQITEKKAFKTFQLTITKGKKFEGNDIINIHGKDYNLLKDPTPNSKRYYFISDRQLIKSINNYKFKPGQKFYGLLEIFSCEAQYDEKTKKIVFSNPLKIKFKPEYRGNKLGFSLFYNSKLKRLEMFYSSLGDIRHAVSKDGINFYHDKMLTNLNSRFTDRDPSISSDGKILVFSSARSFKSNLSGLQLFIAFRKTIYSKFSKPVMVQNAINSVNELFPVIFQNRNNTFVIFKNFSKEEQNKAGTLFSVQIKNNEIYPMVAFSKKSNIPFKYISYSSTAPADHQFTSCYPDNGYDIYRMYINKITPITVTVEITK